MEKFLYNVFKVIFTSFPANSLWLSFGLNFFWGAALKTGARSDANLSRLRQTANCSEVVALIATKLENYLHEVEMEK